MNDTDPGSHAGQNQLTVELNDRQDDHPVDADRWATLAVQVATAEGVAWPSELGLAFVGGEEMAQLNLEHMGQPGPTDVLAFPVDGAHRPADGSTALVGDVVVCPSKAQLAVTEQRSLDDELALLVVHGVLHLCGHDHAEADERELMQARERELLALHYAASKGPESPS